MNIALLSTDKILSRGISTLVDSTAFQLRTAATVACLSDTLGEVDCNAALIDLSSTVIENRDIRALKRAFPKTHLILVSELHFHPQLREAIQQNIYACMSKPLDPDEFFFLLRSIEEDVADARNPLLPEDDP